MFNQRCVGEAAECLPIEVLYRRIMYTYRTAGSSLSSGMNPKQTCTMGVLMEVETIFCCATRKPSLNVYDMAGVKKLAGDAAQNGVRN